MTVTFELFGALQRLAGAPVLALDLPGSTATVQQGLDALASRLPDLADHLPRVACAVGDALVLRSARLAPGSRLALLPPVSGG